jgi:hypothetical protein
VRDGVYVPVRRTLLGSRNRAGFMLRRYSETAFASDRTPQTSSKRANSIPSSFCSTSILNNTARI